MSVVIDETRVEAFIERVADEIGAAVNVPLTVIGARLGLYAAMADAQPVTPAELAARTGTHERYVREWLNSQAAGGYAYRAYLVQEWIPALDGVEAKLRAGARVADVGCGHGTATVLLAQAYPESTFAGFDYHAESVERARANAAAAGVQDRVRFEVASATDFPGSGYDLIACFDALHDLGDPAACARRVHEALAEDGTWIVVEPQAGDCVDENLHPPRAHAGEARLSAAIRAGGFTHVRRATETIYNMVLEARA